MIETAAAALMIALSSCSAAEAACNLTPEQGAVPCYVADSGGLTVYDGNNTGGEGFYSLSINGGDTYIPKAALPFRFNNLPESTYQLRLIDERGRGSDVAAACLGDSGIDEKEEILLSVTASAEERYKSGSITVTIENYREENDYLISFDSGRNWQRAGGRTVSRGSLSAGKYGVRARCDNDHSLHSRLVDITVPVKDPAGIGSVSAPLTKQLPQLPTGCEVTSLSMALSFWGINIPKTALADNFLDKGPYRASDYRKVFVGDPRDAFAYGCYAEVIEACANKMLGTVKSRNFDVNNITGCTADKLYAYIDMGYPVIVWATNNMVPTEDGPEWTDADSGRTVKWVGNEHCMLLTGYDKNKRTVTVNDPLYGAVSYDMSVFEQRFRELERQAVVIVETTPPK